MKHGKDLLIAAAVLLFSSAPVCAEYAIVLKNGRRLTVPNYREDGGMIKFPALGGEIGISRDQIESIESSPGRGLTLMDETAVPGDSITVPDEEKTAISGLGEEAKIAEKSGEDSGTTKKDLSPEEKLKEERAREEKEYQDKVKAITAQIKAVRDRYLLATRGSDTPEPTLPSTEEQIRARTEHLTSRLVRDAQNNPLAPRDTVDTPATGYSEREKEISDLRSQISELESARERLIQEMRSKNFDTSDLFLD